MVQEDKEGVKKTKGLPDLSNVSLATGIYTSAVGCFLSYLILSCLVLHSPFACLYPFERLFLTSAGDCCRLWEVASESAFAFILLGLWDHTLLAVGELPFPWCVVLWTDNLLPFETLML